MPTVTEALASGKTRQRVDALALAKIIREMDPDTIVLERVGPRPGQGSVSSWALCRAATLCEGISAALGITLLQPRPQVWRATVGLPKGLKKAAGKTASRKLAATLFPDHADLFRLVKHDGNAEAVLIGLYGAEKTPNITYDKRN